MNNREYNELFEKNVNYIKRNIAPDDIYAFAEQTLMACIYFIKKLNDLININDEILKDNNFKIYLKNILMFEVSKRKEIDIYLDLGLCNFDENDT